MDIKRNKLVLFVSNQPIPIHLLLPERRNSLTFWKTTSISTCQLVERQRLRLWSGSCKVQISGRSNRTQCCQRLATAATFQKELCCPQAQWRGDGPRQFVMHLAHYCLYNERFDLSREKVKFFCKELHWTASDLKLRPPIIPMKCHVERGLSNLVPQQNCRNHLCAMLTIWGLKKLLSTY